MGEGEMGDWFSGSRSACGDLLNIVRSGSFIRSTDNRAVHRGNRDPGSLYVSEDSFENSANAVSKDRAFSASVCPYRPSRSLNSEAIVLV